MQTRYGPPEVVRIAEVERPNAGPGELLVRVRATTVKRTDCGYRAARPFVIRFVSGLRRPRAATLGTEFAGEVEAIGPGVTAFAAGDRVFGYVEGRFGAHAPYLVVAESGSVARTPPNVPFEQAAPATEGAHYALSMIPAAGIRAGQDVLVNGGTGGIGSAAVQILRRMGVRVTAVCATPQLALVAGLGAERVIDYTAEDFTRDEAMYDVVSDAVGKSAFGRCRRLLKPGGIYLSFELGPCMENPVLALITRFTPGPTVLFPFPRHDQAMARYLAGLLASSAFTPLIDRRMPLDEIVEAYRYVESGQKIGNVVLTTG